MEIQEGSDRHVLHPEGELTIFEAAEFQEALLSLCGKSGSLELDLSNVERVDSSGIQLMIAASQDNRLRITGMSVAVSEKVEAIGCTSVIKKNEQ